MEKKLIIIEILTAESIKLAFCFKTFFKPDLLTPQSQVFNRRSTSTKMKKKFINEISFYI
jgi:hypothetical protein